MPEIKHKTLGWMVALPLLLAVGGNSNKVGGETIDFSRPVMNPAGGIELKSSPSSEQQLLLPSFQYILCRFVFTLSLTSPSASIVPPIDVQVTFNGDSLLTRALLHPFGFVSAS